MFHKLKALKEMSCTDIEKILLVLVYRIKCSMKILWSVKNWRKTNEKSWPRHKKTDISTKCTKSHTKNSLFLIRFTNWRALPPYNQCCATCLYIHVVVLVKIIFKHVPGIEQYMIERISEIWIHAVKRLNKRWCIRNWLCNLKSLIYIVYYYMSRPIIYHWGVSVHTAPYSMLTLLVLNG